MAYIKTLWKDHKAPAINAVNLNKIEKGIFDASALTMLNKQGLISLTSTVVANKSAAVAGHNSLTSSILQNKTNIDEVRAEQKLLTSGFRPQGDFTPQASLEYPDSSAHTTAKEGYSYTVTMNNNVDGYTFKAGDLNGKKVHVGDHLYWTSKAPHWHILKHNNVHKATDADVKAGTNNDRYVTPKELKDNYATQGALTGYLPLKGGYVTGTLGVDSPTDTVGFLLKSKSNNKSAFRYYQAATQIVSYTANASMSILDSGDIVIKPKSGKKLLYKTKEVATVDMIPTIPTAPDLSKYLPITGGTMTGTLAIKNDAARIMFKDSKNVNTGTLVHVPGKLLLYNYTGKSQINLTDTGSIKLSTKAGQKASVNGKVIMTGTYSASTKTLTLDV